MLDDDDRCSAEDIGGNLGGPCTCGRCRLADQFDREIAAAHEHMDRKEAELDKFGYGGEPFGVPRNQ